MKERFVAGSAVLCGAFMSCVTVAQDLTHPNILVLFVDDLGHNDLGFRNNQFETSHIDRLAGRSLELSNTYIASPTSSPIRVLFVRSVFSQPIFSQRLWNWPEERWRRSRILTEKVLCHC